MEKRHILFIISTLRCGGAEHALVSLLNVIDYSKYDVELLVLCENGMFYKENVPENVRMIEPDFSVRAVMEPTIENLMKCIVKGRWNLFFIHISRIFLNLLRKNKIQGNFWSYYWNNYGKHIRMLNEKKYDVAIGYLEGTSNYFCIDKVNADRKIGWMHTNYIDSGQNKEMDRGYFKEFDYLVTMSEPASDTLKKAFPEYEQKIHTIHNILDEKQVLEWAREPVEGIEQEFDGITLVSVGNILPVKGYDMAAEACAKLVATGKKIRWFIVGRKDKAEEIEKLIEKYQIQDSFILVGMKQNPYSYIQLADIYVQCSRYEGFSTTIREARVLCKPIVATDCQGINDQIKNGINGTLVNMNAESIFNGILELIDNPEKSRSYESTLKEELLAADDTVNELNKLYQLLD